MKFTSLIFALVVGICAADVPDGMTYQGILTDNDGAVVAPDTPTNRDIEFRIYTSPTDVNAVWGEKQTVTVFKGNFSIVLGNGISLGGGVASGKAGLSAALADGAGTEYYFGITPVGGAEFLPRQGILTNAFSYRAKVSEVAVVAQGLAPGGLAANAITNGTLTGSIFSNGTVDAQKLGTGVVNNTELNYLNGVTSGLQAQLNSKASLSNPTFTGTLRASNPIFTGTLSATTLSIDPSSTNTGSLFPGLQLGGGTEGISSQRTAGNRQWGLSFYTQNTERMLITNDGRFGIGTTNPKAALHVEKTFSSQSYWDTYRLFWNVQGSPTIWDQTTTFGGGLGEISDISLGIYCSDFMAAGGYFAISDERIKKISGLSNSSKDLAVLNKIEITDYTFIDPIAQGTGVSKKVIAQQVEEVFPQAINKSTGVVPDIFKNATIKDGWIVLATDLKKGEKIRLISKETKDVYEVLEVEEKRFRTTFTDDQDEVFVYGREVNDFRMVDYEAISMLNVSATQEIYREAQALKKQVEGMDVRLIQMETLVRKLTSAPVSNLNSKSSSK